MNFINRGLTVCSMWLICNVEIKGSILFCFDEWVQRSNDVCDWCLISKVTKSKEFLVLIILSLSVKSISSGTAWRSTQEFKK